MVTTGWTIADLGVAITPEWSFNSNQTVTITIRSHHQANAKACDLPDFDDQYEEVHSIRIMVAKLIANLRRFTNEHSNQDQIIDPSTLIIAIAVLEVPTAIVIHKAVAFTIAVLKLVVQLTI